MSSSYRSNRLGLSHWDPYAARRGGCLELYHCNMMEWFWWDSSLIFDDQLVSFSALTYTAGLGLIIWPVKIFPEIMTYNVLSGTLSFYTIATTRLLLRLPDVVSVKHDARCVMGKVGEKKTQGGGF